MTRQPWFPLPLSACRRGSSSSIPPPLTHQNPPFLRLRLHTPSKSPPLRPNLSLFIVRLILIEHLHILVEAPVLGPHEADPYQKLIVAEHPRGQFSRLAQQARGRRGRFQGLEDVERDL